MKSVPATGATGIVGVEHRHRHGRWARRSPALLRLIDLTLVAVSAITLGTLEPAYISGARMRRVKEIDIEVLGPLWNEHFTQTP
jgi:hypothetical protein